MPDTIMPDEGIIQQHQDSLQIGISGRFPWKLMLWTNDFLPDFDTVLSDLTEATWVGYGRISITPADWTAFTALDGCSHAQWKLTPIAWPVTSGPLETVFGWAMIDEIAGLIRRVQRFDAEDIAPIVLGVPFLLLPRVTFTSAACE